MYVFGHLERESVCVCDWCVCAFQDIRIERDRMSDVLCVISVCVYV